MSATSVDETQFPWLFAALSLTLEPCGPADIGATDLRAEAERAKEAALETYRLVPRDGGEVGWLLWLPAEGRAGIARGAEAVWTDAESAEEALWRFEAGEMIE